MNTFELRGHLTNLLSGHTTVAELQAIGTDEALEAITISSKNFNEITMTSRDILSAMNSEFVTKVKAGSAAFKLMKHHGMGIDSIIALRGKNIKVRIDWAWSRRGDEYLTILTPLPNGWNGYRLPLAAILQDRDAIKCRKLVKWVLDRADIAKSLN
ncbi:hypothetical protein [Pseudomonas phage Achelous]|uniref:Uncharacterized protein n=1 Tax=Pseudomonas phage Achelous TaxID=2163982 RepID=A0A2S1GMS4_9CAUD|nr:hypothetical protein HOT10_gp11 [Pseudomonas phage Achelous]AWD90688.1 hypothetical protein [Pseudomonas phage Achelous]